MLWTPKEDVLRERMKVHYRPREVFAAHVQTSDGVHLAHCQVHLFEAISCPCSFVGWQTMKRKSYINSLTERVQFVIELFQHATQTELERPLLRQ